MEYTILSTKKDPLPAGLFLSRSWLSAGTKNHSAASHAVICSIFPAQPLPSRSVRNRA
jgi:hypothetical protein